MSMLRVNSLLGITILLCSCAGHTQKQDNDGILHSRIMNYWNGLDYDNLDDSTREQKIVDYLFLMQHSDSITRKEAWDILHSIINNNPDKTVVDYLGEPDSPLHSSGMLEEYLESLVMRLPSDDPSHMRAAYILENIRKNKPGQLISNLGLKTGKRTATTSLHKLINESGTECVILFYDPECNLCNETISKLSSTDSQTYRIIAVSVTGTTNELPDRWLSTRAIDPDELDDKFYLPSLPAIYLVSTSGLIKERY